MAFYTPYQQLFRPPGVAHFFLAALIARMPFAMVTLGIVLMLSQTHGQYGLPSQVASLCIFAEALIAPQLSRLAERYGQTRIALPASLAALVAFGVLVAASSYGWPNWVLFASALAIGLMPNFGAFSRTRWSHLYGGTPLLRSAFALESLCEELIWMSGPIIVVQCAHYFSPQTGVLVAGGFLLVGALYFCAQARTQPPLQAAASPRGGKPAIFTAAVFLPSLTLLAFGGFFGVLEVATPALTAQLGMPAKTWYPLSAYALASLVSGVLYGAHAWRAPLPRQLLLFASAFCLTTVPFFWTASLWSVTLVCLVSGATCSPTIISALRLVESSVAKHQLTESMTWALVSPPIGMAAGFALTGIVVDQVGAQPAFALTALFGVLTVASAALVYRWLGVKSR